MAPFPALLAAAPSILNAGAGMLSSYIQNENSRRMAEASKYNTDKTIEANKQLAEYQFLKNREMWDLMNQYNSPLSQMNRFQEAGLNPNLIYSKGQPGLAASQVQYQAPTVQYDYKAKTLPDYQDVVLKQTLSALQMAQAKKLEAETKHSEVEAQKTIIENDLNRKLNPLLLDYQNLKNEKEKREIGNLMEDMITKQLLNQKEQLDVIQKQYGVDGASDLLKIYLRKYIEAGMSKEEILDKLSEIGIGEQLAKTAVTAVIAGGVVGTGSKILGKFLNEKKSNPIGFK